MDDTKTNDGLKYIGDGATLPNLPPRDLTAEEVNGSEYSLQDLINSGLYMKTKKAYTPKPTKAALKGIEAENEE
jgi:hypothetical protein